MHRLSHLPSFEEEKSWALSCKFILYVRSQYSHLHSDSNTQFLAPLKKLPSITSILTCLGVQTQVLNILKCIIDIWTISSARIFWNRTWIRSLHYICLHFTSKMFWPNSNFSSSSAGPSWNLGLQTYYSDKFASSLQYSQKVPYASCPICLSILPFHINVRNQFSNNMPLN